MTVWMLKASGSMRVFSKSQNTRIKSPNSSAAHVFVCTYSLIRLCSQTQHVPHEVTFTQKCPNTTRVWTHPVTGSLHWHQTPGACQLCDHFIWRKMHPQSVNHSHCQVLLQSFHGALCTEQWISAPCASYDRLFTFSQGKLAARQRVWACQCNPKPQMTWIWVSLHNKTFYSPYKNRYHTYTCLSSKTIKWSETYISTESPGKCSQPQPFSLSPASLSLVNDIRSQSFKRSIPLMSGNLIFKLPYKNRCGQSCSHFSAD